MLMTFVEMRDCVLMALGSLRANKLRSGLTILGVLIGVASVIGLASLINGLNAAMEQEISGMGAAAIIEVERLPAMRDWDDLTEEERNRPELTVGEAEAIRDHCPSVDGVAPTNHYWAPGGNVVKYQNRKVPNVRYFGTWPDYMRVRERSLQQGRFLGSMDEARRAHVAVIGHDIANTLFEGRNPIGQEIRVNDERFEVIGVFEKAKSNFGNTYENNAVAIPLSTFEKIHPWEEALGLSVRAVTLDKLEQAKEEVIGALRVYRKVPFGKENNFDLLTQDAIREQVEKITDYIYIAMLVITSVGLMVGGIGVMNIMLVSVTERTREIGIRKAIGAKRSNILLQFLTEATSLSGAGGTAGIIIGVLFGVAVNSAIGFPIAISVFWIVVGFLVAVSVGMISGMYPAVKAAKLDPIEALRYE